MVTEEISKGMAIQRGIDVVDRVRNKRPPLLLTDDELDCLEVLAKQEESGSSRPRSAKIMLDAYSDPETIRNGFRVLEQLGELDYGTSIGDRYTAPYEKQMKKIGYVPRWRR